MRLGLLIAAIGLAGTAYAVTPVDPFDEMLKVCAAKNPAAIPAAMSALHAEAMSTDETDRLRFGQSIGLAYGVLHMDKTQEELAKQDFPTQPEYFGWRLGRATLISAVAPGQGQFCSVSVPYDKFDSGLAALKGLFGFGEPEKDLTFGASRVAAWKLGPSLPELMLLGTDFGGDRHPTLIQFLSK